MLTEKSPDLLCVGMFFLEAVPAVFAAEVELASFGLDKNLRVDRLLADRADLVCLDRLAVFLGHLRDVGLGVLLELLYAPLTAKIDVLPLVFSAVLLGDGASAHRTRLVGDILLLALERPRLERLCDAGDRDEQRHGENGNNGFTHIQNPSRRMIRSADYRSADYKCFKLVA